MKDGRHMLSREGGTASSPRFKSKRRSEGPDIFKGVEERRGRTNQDLRNLSALATCNLCTRRSLELEEVSSEIGKASAFPDVSVSVTCTLSFAEITGSLSKRRSQISKRHQSFSASSTPVTCTLSLAKITDKLSKISDEKKEHVSHINQSLNGCRLPGTFAWLLTWFCSRVLVFHCCCTSKEAATSAWRTDKASENDTLQHVETMCRRNKQKRMQPAQSTQQNESELRNSKRCHILPEE
ncbi:hypothetical protein ACFX2I_024350 [Malus domestica]